MGNPKQNNVERIEMPINHTIHVYMYTTYFFSALYPSFYTVTSGFSPLRYYPLWARTLTVLILSPKNLLLGRTIAHIYTPRRCEMNTIVHILPTSIAATCNKVATYTPPFYCKYMLFIACTRKFPTMNLRRE